MAQLQRIHFHYYYTNRSNVAASYYKKKCHKCNYPQNRLITLYAILPPQKMDELSGRLNLASLHYLVSVFILKNLMIT